MADQTTIKWLYPPDFEGTFPADAVQVGPRKYIIQCTSDSDGTGEVDEVKVRRTDLLTTNGNVPSKLTIEKIEYAVSGMNLIIGYNNMDEEVAAIITDGSDVIDFTPYGGFTPSGDHDDDGGDIIFTTNSPSLGDSYNVIMTIRPKD